MAANPPLRPRESTAITLSGAATVAIFGTFLILLLGALYYARSFFLPVMLAFLLTLTFSPLVRGLARRGLPPVISATTIMVSIGAGLVATSILLAEPTARMAAEVPAIVDELRERFGGFKGAVSALVEAGKEVQEIADGEGGPGAPQKVVLAPPGILSWLADTLSGIGGTLAATLLLAVFLLASGDLFLQKLVRVLPTLADKKRSVRLVHDVENEVSRYLLTITAINIGFGTAVGLAMAALGMPNPVLWGVGAALLNYVPYLGALVGMALAGAIGLITFPTLGMALLPPLAYFVCNAIEGSVVTPLTLGRRLELNPVAILLALAFGGWMWGIVGALIGVPLLVVVKVLCDHFPRLATFGEFLSREALPLEAAASGDGGHNRRD
jgi:predicted PurR-regulated permease PerM